MIDSGDAEAIAAIAAIDVIDVIVALDDTGFIWRQCDFVLAA